MREIAMLLLGALFGWLGQFWVGRVQRKELFDHQLRIEKEYQIYTDLWENLFEFRRAAHGLVDPLQNSTQGNPQQRFVSAFNAFQAVVRRNEPFIFPRVFVPSRAIVKQGWAIAHSSESIKGLEEYRDHLQDLEADERVAEQMIEEDKNQGRAVKEIDELFPKVKAAIQARITLTPAAVRNLAPGT